MPVLLAFLAILALLSPVPSRAWSDSDTGTVRLLVPTEARTRLEGLLGSEDLAETGASRMGWIGVDMPLQGSAEKTAQALSERLGAEVLVASRYLLYGAADEPALPLQWYHDNRGENDGVDDADIDTPDAWAKTTGSGVVVAVVDSGVEMTHPDLAGRFHPAQWDFIDDDADPSPGPYPGDGHGTALAGVIAAAANGVGISGVAPDASIMVIRSCENGGCFSDDLASGIRFAVDNGADIINLSLGLISAQPDPLMEEAIAYARDRNVVVVAAAGNEGFDLDADLRSGEMLIPGGLPYGNVVAVGATDNRDQRAVLGAGQSNVGAATVDLAAPGKDIYTTDLRGGYAVWSGTSLAAPMVSGVAALLLSADPGLGYQELIARIEASVDQPASIAGMFATGRLNGGRTIAMRFVDTSGSVFLDDIDWLAGEGITEGCNPPGNTRFCPDQAVTRGEMAMFLYRALDLPPAGADYFDDDQGAFYQDAANRLYAAGITLGCGDRSYCGETVVRRDQTAAMLARALTLPAATVDRFGDDNGSIFEEAINRVAAAGISLGCNPPSGDLYCPERSLTRGEMAAYLRRSAPYA